MGMTIDKAIEYNKNLKMYMEISDRQDTYKFLEENHIALDMAIDTMRKYQKILEIVKQKDYKDYDRFNTHNYYGDFLRVQDIRKVIQYGNVD